MDLTSVCFSSQNCTICYAASTFDSCWEVIKCAGRIPIIDMATCQLQYLMSGEFQLQVLKKHSIFIHCYLLCRRMKQFVVARPCRQS
jgi:hypothetical protein